MSIEAMKLALDALEEAHPKPYNESVISHMEAITALRTAIAEAEKQEPVAWMTINAYGEEDDISYENPEVSYEKPEGHLPAGWTYMPLYTHPPKAKQAQEEPLGYWNAVEGWVELPEEEHKPVAWVYPEALDAFLQGKPWTAYGADGKGPNTDGVERIPLYNTPPAAQPEPDLLNALKRIVDEPNNTMSDGKALKEIIRIARAAIAAAKGQS